MTTHVVATATERLIQRAEMVKKAFLNCSISMRSDGLEDCFINIKDIPLEAIDFTGWEEAEDFSIDLEEEVDLFLDDKEIISMDDNDLLMITRYHKQYVKDLQQQLKSRGLKTSEKKAELVRRLQDNNLQKSRVCKVRDTIYYN